MEKRIMMLLVEIGSFHGVTRKALQGPMRRISVLLRFIGLEI